MKQAKVFHGFVGQSKVMQALVPLVQGAKLRGKPCQHMLIVGGSGLGKTELAAAIAKEYGTKLHIIWATPKTTDLVLGEAASSWLAHDFVFIDECHTLLQPIQELVFRIMAEKDPKAPKIETSKSGWKSVCGEVVIAPVTIIAATDQPGKLTNAFRKRTAHTFFLQTYSEQDMIDIIRQRATKFKVLVKRQAARRLAFFCRGNPRIAGQHLAGIRDYFASTNPQTYTTGDIRTYMKAQGFDQHGRNMMEQTYMQFLDKCGGKNVSLETLSLGLKLDPLMLRREVEPWLVQQGWVKIERPGRCLTESGKALLGNTRTEVQYG